MRAHIHVQSSNKQDLVFTCCNGMAHLAVALALCQNYPVAKLHHKGEARAGLYMSGKPLGKPLSNNFKLLMPVTHKQQSSLQTVTV